MNPIQPPRIAAWLLRHFGSSRNNDAVIGDLDERYRQGRPLIWYWREAMVAILMSFIRAVRDHKLLALRTLLIGWALTLSYVALMVKIINPFLIRLEQNVMPIYPTGWLNRAIATIEPHWWAYRNYYVYPAALGLVRIAGSCFLFILIGWFLTRLHQPHRGAFVLMFVVTLYLLALASFLLLARHAPTTTVLFGDAVNFLINLIVFTTPLIGRGFVNASSGPTGANLNSA